MATAVGLANVIRPSLPMSNSPSAALVAIASARLSWYWSCSSPRFNGEPRFLLWCAVQIVFRGKQHGAMTPHDLGRLIAEDADRPRVPRLDGPVETQVKGGIVDSGFKEKPIEVDILHKKS